MAYSSAGKTSNPYIRAARKTLDNYMNKKWLQGWQWAVEVSASAGGGFPEFDLYAKDISFGAGSVDVDTVQVGSGFISFPTAESAGEITMTVRDDEKQTLSKWVDARLAKVKNKDGTINLPKDYIFTITLYTLDENGERTLYKSYQVYPTKKGELTWSREDVNSVMSFPLIFQKFSSVGNKVF